MRTCRARYGFQLGNSGAAERPCGGTGSMREHGKGGVFMLLMTFCSLHQRRSAACCAIVVRVRSIFLGGEERWRPGAGSLGSE